MAKLSEKITDEQVEEFDLRKSLEPIESYTFKQEDKPGIITYHDIELNKKYRINNPGHKGTHNQIVEVTSFLYKWNADEMAEQPLGVGIKFQKNNKNGTYYKISHLNPID